MFVKSSVEELFKMDKKKFIEDWKKQNPIKAIIEEDGIIWRMYSQTSMKDVADHEASQIRDVGFRARIKGPFKDGKYAWIVYAGPRKVFNYDNRVIKLRSKLPKIPTSFRNKDQVLAWIKNAVAIEKIFPDRELQEIFEAENVDDEYDSDKRSLLRERFGNEIAKWWYKLANSEGLMCSFLEDYGYEQKRIKGEKLTGPIFAESGLTDGRLGEIFNEESFEVVFGSPAQVSEKGSKKTSFKMIDFRKRKGYKDQVYETKKMLPSAREDIYVEGVFCEGYGELDENDYSIEDYLSDFESGDKLFIVRTKSGSEYSYISG